jgi:release factor glutamine methyltransferase
MAPATGSPSASGERAANLLADAQRRLAAAGSATARLDAELLVSHAFDRGRAWLLAHPEAPLPPEAALALDRWVERRMRGEPVAYIRGFKEWFELRLATDRRALIPRPETELLAEAAIAEIGARLVRDADTVTCWDVATGAGPVALALALRFRASLALGRLRLVASDLSPDAIELAAENLESHGASGLVTLAVGDLLTTFPTADVITANLPYVPRTEVDAGGGSLAYEPRLALDGGADGLDVLRRFTDELPARLSPGGVALLEVGAGQASAVREMAERLTVPVAVTLLPDLAGIERVVRVTRLD